jgi:hypothetical protein
LATLSNEPILQRVETPNTSPITQSLLLIKLVSTFFSLALEPLLLGSKFEHCTLMFIKPWTLSKTLTMPCLLVSRVVLPEDEPATINMKNEHDCRNEVVEKAKRRLMNYQVGAEEMKEKKKKKPFFLVSLRKMSEEEPAMSESG